MSVGGPTTGPRILVFFWLAISVLAQSSSMQSPSASFAYPPAESTGKPRLTINVLDTVDVEWDSNYGQTWLYLWCDEYKPEDNGKMVTYRWFTKEVFASGDTTYRPWDALESDTNNRTGKYPYSCHFELIYSNEEQQGIVGPDLNITSRAGETIATTFARRATQVGTTATPTPTSLSSAMSLVSQTASSSSSPTATSSSSPATPSANDNGLSTGAKAGIAIGAIFAVVAVAAIGYLFYRNHRKLRELESRAYPQERNVEPKTAATEYYRQDYQPVPPSELEQHHTYELPTQPQEMDGVEPTKQ
ncbi:hypothetical protein EKO04_006043 [Ascochyta lentis]|uniref:Uncharacterized protein n=1 Tax=Ascochyta lentis TaxID=205686 RepID=A0A8H7J4B6_9PLEO|nr:hypothetical protein EKO04_006043 [Ascochyta lentis]